MFGANTFGSDYPAESATQIFPNTHGYIYWVNPKTTDYPFAAQAALHTWLTIGGRRHKGYLIKLTVDVANGVKKAIVGGAGMP